VLSFAFAKAKVHRQKEGCTLKGKNNRGNEGKSEIGCRPLLFEKGNGLKGNERNCFKKTLPNIPTHCLCPLASSASKSLALARAYCRGPSAIGLPPIAFLCFCKGNSAMAKEASNECAICDKQNSEELIKFILDKNLNPVFIYDNLSDSTIKTRILNETRGLSGIYLILNKFTMDYYVGSASTGKFHARFTNHLFNLNGSKVLKNAVKKYSISSFAFIVLELFPEIVNKENNKNLLNLEDFYLKSLLPNYNILTEAGSSFGYKHSEITRIKMKSNYSEERRKAIGSLNKGKSLSPNTIELMRQAALNRTKPLYSAEGFKNMQKRSKPILVYNLDYTVYGEFTSIVEAASSIGCYKKTIIRALQSPKKILRRR
jgi:group I intron endonuclease